MTDLRRRLAAEALGTAMLVATVVGSGIMASRLTGDVALSLLGNTIPTGAILVVLITTLGPVSGAHFNPAVTLVFGLRRDIGWLAVLGYVTVQILGGPLRVGQPHDQRDCGSARAVQRPIERPVRRRRAAAALV